MISSTSCGSFVAYTANESPTSKLKPHPVRSSSKWRVSFADSGPLRRRLTTRRAGKGFARVYRVAATVAAALAVASIIATLVAVIRQRRKFHPSFPIASVGQTSMAREINGRFVLGVFQGFGASSRHRRHSAQVVSTYHGPER